LTAPGIPDIYQGSERGDFSLVDPDNRRPLDPAVLTVPQKPRPSRATFADYKQWLVAAVLAERNRAGGNPFAGAYIPLEISDGSRRALAFLRAAPEAFAITVVPRLTFDRIAPEGLYLSAGALEDVVLHLPAGFAGRDVRSVLDGRTYPLRPEMPLADILGTEPVALLVGA
jgi:(1->4)-alpha-D-glucan 1-alpha-D-glucosylmutase